MPDLVLTHGSFLSEDPPEWGVMKPYPPLGLLYLSSYLKDQGFAVDVVDTTFAERPDVTDTLTQGDAPVLGLYTNMLTRRSCLALIEAARDAGKTVVVGGPDAATYPEAYLTAGADVVAFGEGEATLAELLPALSTGSNLSDVKGIAFTDNEGQVRRTESRPALADLDALPWPDREAIDIDAYLACWRRHHGQGAVSLITARGCPYRCRWCSHAVFGYTHRRRSPEDVAAEVAHLRQRYDPDMLWFADDVFTIHPRWLLKFAEIMAAQGPPLPFETITRADRVTDEVVDAMARLGCDRVWLGSESGSQRILDAMERGVTVEQIRWATRRFQAAGIRVGLFVMWGYEGEVEADIQATVDHVVATRPDTYLTTVAYPMTGTPYFDDVAPSVVRSKAWSEATERDHLVAGRPGAEYYRWASRRLAHAVAADDARRRMPWGAATLVRERLAGAWARWQMRRVREDVVQAA